MIKYVETLHGWYYLTSEGFYYGDGTKESAEFIKIYLEEGEL